MDVVGLLPRPHLLRFPVGQAHLRRDGDEVTPIDAGHAGCGARIAAYARAAGRVRRVVPTHFHEDRAGGTAEAGALAGADVVAHALDAPVVRGEVPGPPPALEDWERPPHEGALRRLPRGGFDRPARVAEVVDGRGRPGLRRRGAGGPCARVHGREHRPVPVPVIGDPVTARAGDVLRAAARTYGVPGRSQPTGVPASR
ncbi:MBL fold metallo-hydrolase [Streptomyces sp. CS159]|uniref:MBL fold metallo-hydrolase n=1 Tax=Streptomyces sp. CS159 TaxID=1982762 RepID=UPI002689ECE9|nr:MBL fold metallo-hydrolase [Streptomyces sp. CS159]